jgi:hypothetical protein
MMVCFAAQGSNCALLGKRIGICAKNCLANSE